MNKKMSAQGKTSLFMTIPPSHAKMALPWMPNLQAEAREGVENESEGGKEDF
jgi:hypothetical protein